MSSQHKSKHAQLAVAPDGSCATELAGVFPRRHVIFLPALIVLRSVQGFSVWKKCAWVFIVNSHSINWRQRSTEIVNSFSSFFFFLEGRWVIKPTGVRFGIVSGSDSRCCFFFRLLPQFFSQRGIGVCVCVCVRRRKTQSVREGARHTQRGSELLLTSPY